MPPPLKEGPLDKRGGGAHGIKGKWKRGIAFKLVRDKLCYTGGVRHRGEQTIALGKASAYVFVDDCAITLRDANGRTWYLQADDEDTAAAWGDQIAAHTQAKSLDERERTAATAGFLMSKVSKQVFDVDTAKKNIEDGDVTIGTGGVTAKHLKAAGYAQGQRTKVVTDNDLTLHDRDLPDWKGTYNSCAALTQFGTIINCCYTREGGQRDDLEGFRQWFQSQPCRNEVAAIPDGRLF
eukprot:COSAG01_NODE_20820_length_933_cov_5.226619_1_plen_236_part_10